MKGTGYLVLAAFALALATSCGLAGGVSTDQTYEQCAEAKLCRISGVISINEVDHVEMGRLTLADGRCVNVSLPLEKVAYIKQAGPQQMTIVGKVYGTPSDPNVMQLTIAGRRVGWNQCGNFFVFVK